MDKRVEKEFQFLVRGYSFERIEKESGTCYRSTELVIAPTFNERGGFELGIVFLSHGSQDVSAGTILAALDRHRSSHRASWLEEMSRQALFIQSNFLHLLKIPAAVDKDLCALRFWHAATWRSSWGTTIIMSQEEISQERDRLDRVQTYFGTGL